MSRLRTIWNVGQALDEIDLGNLYSNMRPDGEIMQSLMQLKETGDVLIPLAKETATAPSHMMVRPSSTAGAVDCDPFVSFNVQNHGSVATNPVAYNGRSTARITSPKIASNASGSLRRDLVYVKLQFVVTSTNHKAKLITGQIDLAQTSETIADVGAASLGVLQNAFDETVNALHLAGLQNTDAAIYIPVAAVYVQNGYTLGTALNPEPSGGTFIRPVWPRMNVAKEVGLHYTAASIFTDAIAQTPTTPIRNGRWRMDRTLLVVAKQTVDPFFPGFGTTFTIDSKIDWNNRLIRGWLMRCARAGSAPYYPAPEAQALAGADIRLTIDPVFLGAAGADASINTITLASGFNGGASGSQVIKIRCFGTPGRLIFEFDTDPFDIVNGDHYLVGLDFTEPFSF